MGLKGDPFGKGKHEGGNPSSTAKKRRRSSNQERKRHSLSSETERDREARIFFKKEGREGDGE